MTLDAALVSQAWSAPGREFQATLDFSSLHTHTWAPCTMRLSAASPPSAGWCWGMRSSTITCLCLFICTTLMFASASLPGAVLIALMQTEAHLHENKSRTEACLRLHSDCRSRMAFLVPAMVVTQATVLCNKEPTLLKCGPSRTACLPACAWHWHTEWQPPHLLMTTGNKTEKKKMHIRSVAQSASGFPQVSRSIFGSRWQVNRRWRETDARISCLTGTSPQWMSLFSPFLAVTP